MRLIDADALKYKNVAEVNGILTHILTAEEIDLAPTVEAYTEEDAKQAIKDSFDSGYEMAKNKYERPQGEWIRVDDNIGTCFVCDHCGNKGHVSKFCSNCGAKMKGGAE